MNWRIIHKTETASTNVDARTGETGDVFTADFQTAGRGRLDHVWLSPPGTNLMLSAVLDVSGLEPAQVATLPLAVGIAVLEALATYRVREAREFSSVWTLKWPNDVLAYGRKVCGILCERVGDRVVAGLGVNVNQTVFAPEIAARATSLALLGVTTTVPDVRDRVLKSLDAMYVTWRRAGLAAFMPRLREVDALRGKVVTVRRTDDDASPVCGRCGGIRADGALDVAGEAVYAGEVHVSFSASEDFTERNRS